MLKRYQRGFIPGATGVAVYVIIGLAIALALTIAGSGMAIWFLDRKLEKAEEGRREAVSALAKEEQSRKGFQATAASCSAGTAALEARASTAEQKLAASKGQSEALTGAVQAHIRALLTAGRKPGEGECEAMKRNLDEEIDLRAAKKGATNEKPPASRP